ncbi:MAG TPA: hypothetical protein VJ697_12360 [Nitrososphaeraceae archaeon]|nr:hypothetical protein [Nitrososphaeraceae archaeon]
MSNSNSNSNSDSDEKEFDSNTRTQKNQKNDPLTEYNEKEPMTPAKIKEHEPTAVKRDPNDQTIVSGGGQTGTDSPEALEEYRRKGMTKVGEDNTTITETSTGQQQYQTGEEQQQRYQQDSVKDEVSETADTLKEGAESTFDKIKAGAKALGKKVVDPGANLDEEYNKEKSE